MLGKIFKRFKASTSGLASSALAANEEIVMEAMIASTVLVAYADGTCSNKEVDAVNAIIQSNPQLKLFRNEPARLFDSYCDQMEASSVQCRLDLMNKIKKLEGDTENSERVLIMALEVAKAEKARGADDAIGNEEEDILSEIARTLDLRLGKYE